MKDKNQHAVWLRVGGTLFVTEGEMEMLMHSEKDVASYLLHRLLQKGRFEPNGDSYIPADCVDAYNQNYETTYCVEDVEFSL